MYRVASALAPPKPSTTTVPPIPADEKDEYFDERNELCHMLAIEFNIDGYLRYMKTFSNSNEDVQTFQTVVKNAKQNQLQWHKRTQTQMTKLNKIFDKPLTKNASHELKNLCDPSLPRLCAYITLNTFKPRDVITRNNKVYRVKGVDFRRGKYILQVIAHAGVRVNGMKDEIKTTDEITPATLLSETRLGYEAMNICSGDLLLNLETYDEYLVLFKIFDKKLVVCNKSKKYFAIKSIDDIQEWGLIEPMSHGLGKKLQYSEIAPNKFGQKPHFYVSDEIFHIYCVTYQYSKLDSYGFYCLNLCHSEPKPQQISNSTLKNMNLTMAKPVTKEVEWPATCVQHCIEFLTNKYNNYDNKCGTIKSAIPIFIIDTMKFMVTQLATTCVFVALKWQQNLTQFFYTSIDV